jgi:acyl-CoA synthetase (AMP-forming)/AMP-acid ligase II
VIYSHRSMYLHTMAESLASTMALTESDVILPVVPQFHAMAWGLPYAAAMVGAELVMPGPHLKPEPIAELIANEKVTVAAGVPSIWNGLYHELMKNPRDTSSVRASLVGGSAMPRSLIEAFEKDLNIPVLHAWGMTETSPMGSVSKLLKRHENLPLNEQWDLKAKQGYAIPGIEMRIMGEEGGELAWDGVSVGELQVRGAWTAGSYYKYESDQFTEDGWFRTGDVVTINIDGIVTITDRTKDLIKSGGEWISSVAIENALTAHPDVLEAAVIAIPNDEWSERPLAVTVRAPGKTIMAEALKEFLKPKFAKFWLPDSYVFLDEIPKTSVGKFDKKILRQRFAAGQLG